MKHILLDMLDKTDPSAATLNTCIALIARDHNCAPPGTDHEQLLRKGRDAALETAVALEQAAATPRVANLDHMDLHGRLTAYLAVLKPRPEAKGYVTTTRAALKIVVDELQDLLAQHETARTLRALRHR